MAREDCIKCGGRMEPGFMSDSTYGANVLSQWIEGVPIVSKWVGLKLKGRRKIATSTKRCTRCGYLESYAIEGSG